MGGHCLVGQETIIVRSANKKLERVTSLAAIFSEHDSKPDVRRFTVDGAEVLYKPGLEALSLDVETQQPVWKTVTYIFRRKYEGELVTVTTSDNRRLTATDKHPMLVSDEQGRLRQVFARDLILGGRIPIHYLPSPVMGGLTGNATNLSLDLFSLIPSELAAKARIRIVGGSWRDHRESLRGRLSADSIHEFVRQNYIPLNDYLALERSGDLSLPHQSLRLHTGRGPSMTSFPVEISLTPGLARLIGYYLAEGCITRESGRYRVRFTFNSAETEFINDVRSLLQNELGVKSSVSHSKIDKATHIRASSPFLGWLFAEVLGCGVRSTEMRVPDVLMSASPVHRRELLKGLLRGDGDVYVITGKRPYRKNGRSYISRNASAEVGFFSSSPILFQQSAYLLQSLGFTPTFNRVKPHLRLKGREQLMKLRGWLGNKGKSLERYFEESRRAPASKTFKAAGLLMTVPIKSTEIVLPEFPVDVYSIEVEDTHTFAASFGIYVHNCIPLDPQYLSWKARLHGFEARFIGLAEEVNSRMPNHVVQLVQDGLNELAKPVRGSQVLVLGVAYKRDIDDVRESPALGIIDQLLHKGAVVKYHDPFVPYMDLDGKGRLENAELTDEILSGCDCAVIVTDHSKTDYARVVSAVPLVIDTRNVTRKLGLLEHGARIIRL
ncbi:MAG: hypothetical protein L0229_28735 [Blastocatellia bacterium]|nr:hypothetical protein [Blastocatellia bacterium]